MDSPLAKISQQSIAKHSLYAFEYSHEATLETGETVKVSCQLAIQSSRVDDQTVSRGITACVNSWALSLPDPAKGEHYVYYIKLYTALHEVQFPTFSVRAVGNLEVHPGRMKKDKPEEMLPPIPGLEQVNRLANAASAFTAMREWLIANKDIPAMKDPHFRKRMKLLYDSLAEGIAPSSQPPDQSSIDALWLGL